MYLKQWTAILFVQKSSEISSWVKWAHQSRGLTQCEECLKLGGCWFLEDKAPTWPHHPYCHCILEPINYAVVLMSTSTYSDYSKFNPYLFDPDNFYKHGKNKAFESWGYTVDDAHWLQTVMEQQAREKYIAGGLYTWKIK